MRVEDAGPRTWLLATVAGWALLCWLLALAGMGRHVGELAPDSALLRPLPGVPAPAADRIGPLSRYAQIGTRPLFSQDRQPKAFFLQGQGDGQNEQNAFDFVLTSVLITPDLKLAILQPADGSRSLRVKLGEVPEAYPAWRLTALDARSAVFEGPQGRREMTLRVFDGRGGQAPTAVGVPPRDAAATPVGVPVAPAPTPMAAPPRPVQPAPGVAQTNANGARTVQTPPPPSTETTDAPLTPESQMEAIRKRIEARRAQLRQQQATQTPAKTN